ncbi:MAG: response regulator [Acidimicrobiales bacterium]
MVVDDNEAVRTSFAEIISSVGYSVITAEDGLEALAILSDTAVGMVVLDVRMPRLDGITMLGLIDDLPPVVLLTAMPFNAKDKMADKVLWYMQKPVDPQHLLDAVASAIGSPDGLGPQREAVLGLGPSPHGSS